MQYVYSTVLTYSQSVSRTNSEGGTRHYTTKSLSALQRLFAGDTRSNDMPLSTFRHPRGETATSMDANEDETERHL